MWFVLLILLQAPTDPQVTVQPLSGAAQSGRLIKLDGEAAVVEQDGQQQTYKLRELMGLATTTSPDKNAANSPLRIQLVDGSTIVASSYQVSESVAAIESGSVELTIPTRNILSVRFRSPEAAIDKQWQEISAARSTGDVIVIRSGPAALDQLEGVFHDVSEAEVTFEFDDQRIDVKRTKLEGMVYHHPAGRELPTARCRVYEANGTFWQAQSIVSQGTELKIVTPTGTQLTVPWQQLSRIDFSSTNVAMLSDLEFDLVACEPFFASRISKERIQHLYGPRRDRSFAGEGLWLDNEDEAQQFAKGLAIHSRSQLVFRLTDPYRRLTAVAGIDSRVTSYGSLTLVISGDNRELYRREISRQEEPIEIDIDITGVQRLSLLVDYGTSLDIADHLNLCNARIIK